MKPFEIIEPTAPRIPILISVPHCGTEFPDEIKSHYIPERINTLDDTDWFVDRIYKFASELGITIIKAKYHRWVIDLNRDPESKPLYNDGRIITALCPNSNFFGSPIYTDESKQPDQTEIERRLKNYYWPYYAEIQRILDELKFTTDSGEVLFYDAHSIRKKVSTIRKDPFPDLILGTNDEKSADSRFIKKALENLNKSGLEVTHNFPFKGGHLTRYFGKPDKNQHALQLERAKIHYMEDDEITFSEERTSVMQSYLRPMFEAFVQELKS